MMTEENIDKLAVELLKTQIPGSEEWAQEAIDLGKTDPHSDCANDACSKCFAEEYRRMAIKALEFVTFIK
jgi:hypothetical protein